MNKKLLLTFLALSIYICSFSQDTPPTYQSADEPSKGFRKENIFLGKNPLNEYLKINY